jgi:hypothetical protein
VLAGSTDPSHWQRLSALLDQGLDLGAAERASWLARMAADEPAIADER